MSKDEHLKILKKKMVICTILQRRKNCVCAKDTRNVFCIAVEELYEIL